MVPQAPQISTLYFTRLARSHRALSGVKKFSCTRHVSEGHPVSSTTADEPTRRDFLYIATGAAGAVGVAFAAWPFIDQMNPSASVLALSTIEVDIASIAVGQQVVFNWRGPPLLLWPAAPKAPPRPPAPRTHPLPRPH